MSKSSSNTCSLVCIPLKRAADIDVSRPLNSLIKSNFSTSVNFKERNLSRYYERESFALVQKRSFVRPLMDLMSILRDVTCG